MHFQRKAATNDRLIMYVNNAKFRSDAARTMSAYVKTERNKLQQFHNFVMDQNNVQRINNAIQNPDSQYAKLILKEISPFIMITGGKIPYSPLERGTRAVAEVFAMCRYLNIPNLFYTVGFDERRNCFIAKIACFGKSEELKNYMKQQYASSAAFWKFGDNILDSNFHHLSTLLPADIIQNNAIIEHELWRQEISDHIKL